MITLAGYKLNDNLHLIGLETNPDLSYSVRELLGGPAAIQIDSRDVGASLALTARDDGTSRMGEFCKSQIDALKTVAKLLQPVELVHPNGTYTVYILRFNVKQSDEKEIPGPNKKFHGEILLQEV